MKIIVRFAGKKFRPITTFSPGLMESSRYVAERLYSPTMLLKLSVFCVDLQNPVMSITLCECTNQILKNAEDTISLK